MKKRFLYEVSEFDVHRLWAENTGKAWQQASEYGDGRLYEEVERPSVAPKSGSVDVMSIKPANRGLKVGWDNLY